MSNILDEKVPEFGNIVYAEARSIKRTSALPKTKE